MTLIKRILGFDTQDERREYEFHRQTMKNALARQSEASEKAESTLVDMLTRVQKQERS